ncbi:MAG: sensor histidine kinase [Terracidiphilus sp.]|jgi:signal transduction histidine kinase
MVQDRTAGIWIDSFLRQPCDQGDEVEVLGVVGPGLFSPIVKVRTIAILGRTSLPKPQAVSFKQMSTGEEDDQYVSITGVVRSAGLRPGESNVRRLWLKIAMPDGFVYASFPEEDAEQGNKLIDSVVRIEGTTISFKNAERQITAPSFVMVMGMQHLTVLQPPPKDPFALPPTPIGKLMQFRSATDCFHRVRIAGIVTYYKPGESLILEDGGRALLVMTAQTTDLQLGDRIEALGFPALQDSGPIVQDAVLRLIAHGQQLQPTSVKIADLTSGALNNNLVSTQGILLTRVHEPFREVLLLQDESNLLLAELNDPNNLKAFDKLREGSSIRIVGVTFLEVTNNWNPGRPSASAVHYKVLLRSANDVLVLQLPSWWTTLHVVYIAALLAVLVLVFLGLIVYGRMEGWRLQAVIEERERLANDIHDTLAQSFAGIGFQLQAIRKAIPGDNPALRQQVDLARALVRHSHKEARRSIEPLSREMPEDADLLSSLETSARRMVEGGSVEVTAVSVGTPRPLPPEIAGALFRVGQEAIANAVRHGDPSHLDISVAYEIGSVRLAVKDNGCGFVMSGNLLGFGLRGMRKRSAAISANLEIVSQPGDGTVVRVTAPLPPDLTLFAFVAQMWKNLLEGVLHVNAKAG